MKKGLISLFTILTIILMSVSLTGCGSAKVEKNIVIDEPAPSGSSDAKEIKLTFTPETINPNTVEMKPGEKVMFTIQNTDPKEDHNFLDPDGGLKEIVVHPGQTVRRLWTVPTKPGTYYPSCAIHPWIKMTFVVK